MSIDFHVYVPRAASGTELGQVIAETAGVDIEEWTPGGGATVVRGAGRLYCCTVEDPLRLDAEDVPAEVAEVTLGAAILYEVLVEGSAAASVAPARRIARGLAKLLQGAVLDPQSDEVWSPKTGRVVAAPKRDERVGVINIDWCLVSDRVEQQTIRQFLGLVRRYLPEALPRRFGDFEPMQQRYEQGGEDGFVEFWSTVGSSVYWSAKLPSAGGHLFETPGLDPDGPAWKVSLDFLSDAFEASPAWRDELRRLFVAVAEEIGAFYACAQMTAGHIWSGGSLYGDNATEDSMYIGGYWWRGLPHHPVWWSWYGPDYAPIVAGQIRGAHTVSETGSGLFHACSELPRTCRELAAEQVPWPSVELTARPHGRPARRIPAALETLAGKRSDDDIEYLQHDPQERARTELRARLDAAEQLVVDDLRAAGVEIAEFSDLATIARDKRLRRPVTIRLLVDQLDRDDMPRQVKHQVVNYLGWARTAAADAWLALREHYLRCDPDDEFRNHLAVALGATGTKQWLAELIELVKDPRNGPTRALMLPALKRSKDARALEALQLLRSDEEIGQAARRLTS